MNDITNYKKPVRVPKGWTHVVTRDGGYVHVVYNMKNIALKLLALGVISVTCAYLYKGCVWADKELTRFDYLERGYSYSARWDEWYKDDNGRIWDEENGMYRVYDIDPWEYESRGFRYSTRWDKWYKPVRKNDSSGYWEYWNDETGRYERKGG